MYFRFTLPRSHGLETCMDPDETQPAAPESADAPDPYDRHLEQVMDWEKA